MAFLLLLHEKMRLRRQVNKLTLKQLQYGNRLDRMTKNITRVQKMYSSKQSQLQKMAQMMQSQATVFFQNAMGLGMQNQAFNPWNYGAGGGVTSFVINQMGGLLANTKGKMPDGVDSDGKPKYKDIAGGMDSRIAQQMLQEYMQGTLKPQYEKDANGNIDTSKIKGYGAAGNYTADQYQVFTSAMSQAQMNQSQAQSMCQQMSQNYQNNVSIWLEAAQSQLEAEQDAALAPLEMEQTDMELEKDSVEQQLAYAKERLKNIEQACSEETQNAAPKFGLG